MTATNQVRDLWRQSQSKLKALSAVSNRHRGDMLTTKHIDFETPNLYLAPVTMSANEAVLTLAMASHQVALIAGRAFRVAAAFCGIMTRHKIEGNNNVYRREEKTRYCPTLACAFSGVSIETDGAQMARVSGRARFAFEALSGHPVAPVGRAHFVVVAAVARPTETAGQERIAEETLGTPVAFDESEI